MSSTLSKLVDETIQDIRTVIRRFGKPSFMCSFGKDSMALLFLLREAGFELPIIYFRDPWQPHKHAFSEKVQKEMGLTVHNWPPTLMGIKFNEERLEFVGRYSFNESAFIDIPKNIEPQLPRQKLLCGLFDIIRRPVCVTKSEFDLILIGHKNSDKDQYFGSMPLHLDLKLNGDKSPAVYFPLRNWSDDEVWNYLTENNVPFQKDRYSDRTEIEDKSFNNDYVQCCSKCLDPRNGEFVECPKFGKTINNVYGLVPHMDEQPNYFGEEKS